MQKVSLNVRNLIFDLDETLVQLPVNWSLVYREMGRLLGMEVSSFTATLSMLWGSDLYWEVSRFVEKYELESLGNLIILDNSPWILRELKEDYTLNLASLQSRKAIENVLNIMGARELFKIIVSRDERPTKREQIKLILSMGDYIASETMVIGDRINDIISALENSCKATLIARRMSELENLKKMELDSEVLIIKSLTELYDILRRRGRGNT